MQDFSAWAVTRICVWENGKVVAKDLNDDAK